VYDVNGNQKIPVEKYTMAFNEEDPTVFSKAEYETTESGTVKSDVWRFEIEYGQNKLLKKVSYKVWNGASYSNSGTDNYYYGDDNLLDRVDYNSVFEGLIAYDEVKCNTNGDPVFIETKDQNGKTTTFTTASYYPSGMIGEIIVEDGEHKPISKVVYHYDSKYCPREVEYFIAKDGALTLDMRGEFIYTNYRNLGKYKYKY
jgi:hypothetical protein